MPQGQHWAQVDIEEFQPRDATMQLRRGGSSSSSANRSPPLAPGTGSDAVQRVSIREQVASDYNRLSAQTGDCDPMSQLEAEIAIAERRVAGLRHEQRCFHEAAEERSHKQELGAQLEAEVQDLETTRERLLKREAESFAKTEELQGLESSRAEVHMRTTALESELVQLRLRSAEAARAALDEQAELESLRQELMEFSAAATGSRDYGSDAGSGASALDLASELAATYHALQRRMDEHVCWETRAATEIEVLRGESAEELRQTQVEVAARHRSEERRKAAAARIMKLEAERLVLQRRICNFGPV